MNCKKCGSIIYEGHRFCTKCGTQNVRIVDFYLCEKCGSKIPNGDLYCGYCGHKQGDTGKPAEDIQKASQYTSKNAANFKVRRLTLDDKIKLEKQRRKLENYYFGFTRSNNNYLKIGLSLVVLILVVAAGVYFLNDSLFKEDRMASEGNEIIGEETFQGLEEGSLNNIEAKETDEELIRNLIMDFNGSWIEFVNNDDTNIFSYIVPGSEVENIILKFKKQGLKEEFLDINIKDVQVLDNIGYVKVHEKIKKIQGGNTEIKEYDWIYEVEKISDKWLVKNYTKDLNPMAGF